MDQWDIYKNVTVDEDLETFGLKGAMGLADMWLCPKLYVYVYFCRDT